MDYRCWNKKCEYYRKLNNVCVSPRGSLGCRDWEAVLKSKAEPGAEVPCGVGLWQPLETVPRDGTLVDLWHKNGFRVTEVWWADDVWSCVMDDDSFTHWMPIAVAP